TEWTIEIPGDFIKAIGPGLAQCEPWPSFRDYKNQQSPMTRKTGRRSAGGTWRCRRRPLAGNRRRRERGNPALNSVQEASNSRRYCDTRAIETPNFFATSLVVASLANSRRTARCRELSVFIQLAKSI